MKATKRQVWGCHKAAVGQAAALGAQRKNQRALTRTKLTWLIQDSSLIRASPPLPCSFGGV